MTDEARCQLCGELMPEGEEMFNYHGYSGPCPKPPEAGAPICSDCEADPCGEACRCPCHKRRISPPKACAEPLSAEAGGENARFNNTGGSTCGFSAEQYALAYLEWRANQFEVYDGDGNVHPPREATLWMRSFGEFFAAHVSQAYERRVKELVDLNNKLAKLNVQQRERAETADKELAEAREAIQKASDIIPASMGGHVTLGLNILQEALRKSGAKV